MWLSAQECIINSLFNKDLKIATRVESSIELTTILKRRVRNITKIITIYSKGVIKREIKYKEIKRKTVSYNSNLQ